MDALNSNHRKECICEATKDSRRKIYWFWECTATMVHTSSSTKHSTQSRTPHSSSKIAPVYRPLSAQPVQYYTPHISNISLSSKTALFYKLLPNQSLARHGSSFMYHASIKCCGSDKSRACTELATSNNRVIF
jgi:hypothetical protein